MSRRAEEVGMEFCVSRAAVKNCRLMRRFFANRGREAIAEVAYIGDDLPDLPILQRVGLAIAVANAVDEVRRAAHHVTRRSGGDARRARGH